MKMEDILTTIYSSNGAKLFIFGFILFLYLKGRGGFLFIFTKDGRKLLELSKEIQQKLGLERKFSFQQMTQKTESAINLTGTYQGKPISMHLINIGYEYPSQAYTRPISELFKGVTLIVKIDGQKKRIAKDEITFKDVEHFLRADT